MMSEQLRDGKGRFVKKEKKWGDGYKDIMLIITICILVGITGYTSYDSGYRAGLADNQEVIRAQGFAEGMTVADNQNELTKEWMPCFINTSPQKFVCNIKDENTVAEVGKNYEIIKT